MKFISPSLLAFDKTKTREQLLKCANANVQMIHYDVMDNKYVPNIAFNGEHIAYIKQLKMQVCVHLMTKNIIKNVDEYLSYPVDIIAIHPDCDVASDVACAINNILASPKNIAPALALTIENNLKSIIPLLKIVPWVIVMGVEPGFGGQKYLLETTSYLKELRNIINEYNLNLKVILDGGVTDEVITITKPYVECYVIGTFLMKNNDFDSQYLYLKNLLKK